MANIGNHNIHIFFVKIGDRNENICEINVIYDNLHKKDMGGTGSFCRAGMCHSLLSYISDGKTGEGV